MKQLPQGLGPLLIEGSMNSVRAARTLLECLFKTFLVELVDGVAHGLRVAAQLRSDLVSIFASGTRKQDLTTAQNEASGERRPAFKVLRSASLRGRTYIGRFT